MRIGELFAGYGGLGMGVQSVMGGSVAWVSDIDRGANKILAHRFPGIPNIGDITKVNWSEVEPVDVLCGGSPCQDLSAAGKRQGMTEGTRSNLWVAMREAIAQLRPRYVVWENVRGAYSAEADSELESDARLLAGTRRRDGEPVLRALGRVLGDLSDLGYDCRWHGLRAADVGAPHGRFRVFVVATDANSRRAGQDAERGASTSDGGMAERRWPGSFVGDGSPPDAGRPQRESGWPAVAGEAQGGRAFGDVAGRDLLPTPRATDGTKGGPNQRGSSGDLMLPSAVALLPTPMSTDGTGGDLIDPWHRKKRGMPEQMSDVARQIEAQRLLPTPKATNNENRQSEGRSERANFHGLLRGHQQWGMYAAAINRWELILGRPAPEPTMTSSKGNPQLSAHFVEFLMGLPAGWVTDVPGITRNEALKALGNGVVSQQAVAALRTMLAWEAVAS